MALLIPEEPDFESSQAERVVWEALATQLPDDAVLLHGQRLTDDRNDVEIDLLILWPGLGAVVLEVKGGVVGIENGRWYTSGSHGRNWLDRSPLEQAMVGKHTLYTYLRSRLSAVLTPVVYAAALPFSTLPRDWDVPDAPRELLFDGDQVDRLADGLATLLRKSYDPDRDDLFVPVDPTVRALRRTHEAMQNIPQWARQIEQTGDSLSMEQERLLRVLRHHARAQISGGAGSGKTHLALMKARTLVKEGKKVALMCYSRGLGRYLQLAVAQWPHDERPAFTGLFHDLPLSWGAEPGSDDDSDYWEVTLPTQLKRLADDRPRRELFDAIVIDEGQDFSSLWWEAVQSCLRNQVEGTLYAFTDEQQRLFPREGVVPIELSPFQLDENLRNSQQIADVLAHLSTEEAIVRNDAAFEVDWFDCDPADAITVADDSVEQLMDEGWEPGDIALLTTGRRHPEHKNTVDTSGYDVYWEQFFAREDVFYGHVLGFKGLERPAVVLCVNGIRDEDRAPKMLYTGVSRATTKLVVVGSSEEMARLGGQGTSATE